jgi:hypothetical protein
MGLNNRSFYISVPRKIGLFLSLSLSLSLRTCVEQFVAEGNGGEER